MFRWFHSAGIRSRARAFSRRRRFQPCLEQLEARNLLSVTSFSAPYTPAQIAHAYGFDKLPADGAGQTIAIVDAYYDPTIANDVATFSAQFGLPQLDGSNGHGTFTQVDLSNRALSPQGDDWTIETALDVEWAHAIAPKANILLVEAASDRADSMNAPGDLLHAVDVARGAVANVTDVNGKAVDTSGVVVVSNSWGVGEGSIEKNYDFHFQTPAGHKGVTFVAATGDSGAPAAWPAVSPSVVAAGGTTLHLDPATGNWASETGWGNGRLSWYYGGSGGGISRFESHPSFQNSVTSSKTNRATPDLSFNADPNTGYYVYDGADGGWFGYVGGTSEASPQIAATIALADQLRANQGLGSLDSPTTLTAIYGVSGADFHDITRGNNGYAAGPGYDLVTGRGSPIANLLVPDLAAWGTKAVSHASTSSVSSSSGSGSVHHFVVVADPGTATTTLTVPPTAPTDTANRVAAQATPATVTGDPFAVQASLMISSRAAPLVSFSATTAPVTAAARTSVGPTVTTASVALTSNSGGSLQGSENGNGQGDRDERLPEKKQTLPDGVEPSAPLDSPTEKRERGKVAEPTLTLIPGAVDALFAEGFVAVPPVPLETEAADAQALVADAEVSRQPALLFGLAVGLALHAGGQRRQSRDRARSLPAILAR